MPNVWKPLPWCVLAITSLAVALVGTALASTGSSTAGKARSAAAKRGPRGARGPRGRTGSRGGLARVHQVTGPTVTACAYDGGAFRDCQVVRADANCPSGQVVTGGGYFVSIASPGASESNGRGWSVIASNDTSLDSDVNAYAMCASAGAGAAAAWSGPSLASQETGLRRQMRAAH